MRAWNACGRRTLGGGRLRSSQHTQAHEHKRPYCTQQSTLQGSKRERERAMPVRIGCPTDNRAAKRTSAQNTGPLRRAGSTAHFASAPLHPLTIPTPQAPLPCVCVCVRACLCVCVHVHMHAILFGNENERSGRMGLPHARIAHRRIGCRIKPLASLSLSPLSFGLLFVNR